MRSFALMLLALCLFTAQSFAQDLALYTKTFKEGYDAINAGRLDEGIAAFKKCLEIVPEEPISAYNLGCAYSRKSEKDTAFEWLEQSANWGFANLDDTGGVSKLTTWQTDTDLTALHEDPRWAKLFERITAARKALDELRAGAAIYIPKLLEGASEMPLLVVLHDLGKTKHSVVEGRWKRIADELGCALVAPSGKLPLKHMDPGAGMGWFGANYATSFRTDERPVADALSAFQKTHKLALDRVYIAGEGMGATVAFNIAVAKPSVYRGVLIVDGNVQAALAAPRVANAVKAGLRVHAILNRTALSARLAGKDAQSVVDGLSKSLADWTLIHKVESFEVKEGETDPSEAMALAAIKSFQVPAAAPVEAGTGK